MKRTKTKTFLLELPLQVNAGQARRLRAHFEVARLFYNAMLGEAKKRLEYMRADPAWQSARAIPCTQKQERRRAFSQLRQQYQFSEYALHVYAAQVRCSWIVDHLDSQTAQKVATRAFQAVNRVALGQAKKVRFRSSRANNPDNYDEKGRIKKGLKRWKESHRYQQIKRKYANTERRLAAHRKSLHGFLVNSIIRLGNTIQIEKTSFKGWQKMFGKSVGLRAPGMFYEHLRRTVAKTGGTLHEVGTYKTKLSQYCHGCKTYHKKPLAQRWHHCECGVGPVQRDLYSAFLLAYLKSAETIPSIYHSVWEGAEPRLRAEVERLTQRANEGLLLPGSMGIPRARARQLKSPNSSQQEPLFQFRNGRVEALGRRKEPKARKG